MFFLNLTAAEFFVLLGTLAGFIAALYLLDKMKRKKIVSTLRFWRPAVTAQEHQSRKRMREPWSFFLQILSLLLLLLAIAQLQWGIRQRRGQNHVLLLDTSAWTAQKTEQGTLLDREKILARQYLAALESSDPVMVVHADSLAAPATAFTSLHTALEQAVEESASGFSALNLEQALGFASQALSASSGSPGEIVYIGPGLVRNPPRDNQNVPNLRFIRVDANRGNCGIRHVGVKPGAETGAWNATVTLKNYGPAASRVHLHGQFAGYTFAPRIVQLPSNQERTVEYTFETSATGALVFELEPHDSLSQDDRAEVWLGRNRPLKLAVFTDRPDVLSPLLRANRGISVTIAGTSQYRPKPDADVMLLDEMSAPSTPEIPSLWIDPPGPKTPLPVRAVVKNASITSWDSSSLLGAALYAKDAQFPTAEVFETFADDLLVGSVANGPIVVARPQKSGHAKLAVIGFDPFTAGLRFQVTTPLLFADLIRWLSPEAFHSAEITAGPVGAMAVPLDPGEGSDGVRVTGQSGFPIPFTIRDHAVQLFAAHPDIVRIASGGHQRILSLTLPDIADVEWHPHKVAEGLPPAALFLPSAIDLWKWLAIAAGLVLLFEWLRYGQRRAAVRKNALQAASSAHPADQDRELVSR